MTVIAVELKLTKMEYDTLLGAARGETQKGTASRRGISSDTAKIQRRQVMAKLNAKTITHAVAMAYELRIIPRGSIRVEMRDPLT